MHVGKRLAGLVLGAVLAMGAVACSNEPSGPSKEAYLQKVIPICKAGQAKIDAAAAKVDSTDPDSRTAYIAATADQVVATMKKVKAIEAPNDDKDMLLGQFAVYERYFKGWQANPEAAVENGFPPDLRVAGEKLKAYGLGACGAGS